MHTSQSDGLSILSEHRRRSLRLACSRLAMRATARRSQDVARYPPNRGTVAPGSRAAPDRLWRRQASVLPSLAGHQRQAGAPRPSAAEGQVP